ncbi:MAG: cobalamin biosynthesis protein CbiD [Lachnospiraceae bacterium]|nr:cobalamin biosynthesis protein CbiD [Lachnospiraceae bacterium]
MQKKLREGYTTGSCAAAASKAAAYMLLTGEKIESVDITVPRGDVFKADLEGVMLTESKAVCAVRKDGGDDPDITTGMLIYATVSFRERDGDDPSEGDRQRRDASVDRDETEPGWDASSDPGETEPRRDASSDRVRIIGGEGIGRVTKPGLDQPVGEWAINSVPRKMIKEAVLDACETAGYEGCLDIVISAPGGEEIGRKTFNPRLGIEGGISIIGTTGIVEPMSEKALKDAIYLELKQRRAAGYTGVVISPGNYGRKFLMETYGYDIDKAVKCSNYIGDTLDMCGELGYRDVILAGHTGKLVKVASGIMNTHSHEADGRMEAIAAAGIRAGLPGEILNRILDSVSTAEALEIIRKYDEKTPGKNALKSVMSTIIERVKSVLDRKADGRFDVEVTIYCGENALVSESAHMKNMLERIMREEG